MTQSMSITLTCPKCAAQDRTEIWASINSKVNPDEAQWLIDGFLFEWTCPECGHTVALNHDCLYHDPAHKIMVQYITDTGKASQVSEALARMRDEGYSTRIVTSQHSLREKAAIARDGLDDRVVELLKFLLFNKFVGDKAIDGSCTAYYGALAEDGGIIVEFVNGSQAQETIVTRDMYDTAAEQVPHLGRELLDAITVDRIWAAKANEQLRG